MLSRRPHPRRRRPPKTGRLLAGKAYMHRRKEAGGWEGGSGMFQNRSSKDGGRRG
jgi:hypothetical protein